MPVERSTDSTVAPPDPHAPVEFEHPRGTLAIVVVFGALFALGWLAMYIFRFMSMGMPQH
jgi:hypothetical protein